MKRFTVSLVVLLITLSSFTTGIFAQNSNSKSSSYTYSKDIVGNYNIGKDAYIPTAVLNGLGLNNANDLFCINDSLYIADSGNSRVLVVNLLTNEVLPVGVGILKDPQGVSADEDGYIYVADIGTEKAYVFKPNGELDHTIEKPTTPNYGTTQSFKPYKIIPSADRGAYIISQGNNAGIAHFNGEGEFLGYFASNEVSMSLGQKIMNVVLTEKQKSKFLKLRPANYENIFLGQDGLIYTVNKGPEVTVKKHAINGTNILSAGKEADYSADYVMDLFVDENGRIFLVQQNGKILVLSSDGQEICEFGGLAEETETVGLFKKPTGIALYGDDVYVLDSERNNIQVFSPSDTQLKIYSAIDLYNVGDYAGSQALLNEVLKYDNTLYLAHYYMGKNYLQQQDYEKAAAEFEICNAKELYSEAYWEIRNEWLQSNLGYIIVAVVIVLLLLYIFTKLNKKYNFISLQKPKKALLRNKYINNFSMIPRSLIHPIDFAYDVKVKKAGNVITSLVMIVLAFFVVVALGRLSGFIYSVPLHEYSIVNTAIIFFSAIALFVVGNYYISELNDGNGTLKGIFFTTSYALSPLLILGPILAIISNFSTLNEAFIVNGLMTFIIGWCLINLVVMLIELHEYTFGKMVKNLIITAIAMLILVITASIAYGLIKQIISFIVEIVKELALRV